MSAQQSCSVESGRVTVEHPTLAIAAPGQRIKLSVCIATTVLLWASAFSGVKAAVREYHPLQAALLRFLVTSTALIGLAAVKGIRRPARADLPRIIAAGLIGMTGYHICFNIGQKIVSAGAASLIINMVPVFTTVLAGMFLREKIRSSTLLGLAVSLTGAAVIAFGEKKGFGMNWGALAILGAATCQSVFFIIQKPLLSRYSPRDMVCFTVWSGTLGLALFAPGLFRDLHAASLKATLCVVYLGLFPGFIAFLAWTTVMSLLPAGRATTFLYLVPVLTMIIAWLWLDEVPSLLTIAGGAMVLGGVVVVNALGQRRT